MIFPFSVISYDRLYHGMSRYIPYWLLILVHFSVVFIVESDYETNTVFKKEDI